MYDCFVENKGQWDSRAQFLLQKPGLNLWLTKDGAVFDLQKRTASKSTEGKFDLKGDVVKVSFVYSGPAKDTALKPISGDFNYFLGNDPKKWRSHVHRYAEVHTGEIYKGIALRYYIDGGSPRYDLIVKPGADPNQVAMKFDGAQDVRVASNGSLIVKTPFGELEENGLVAYQQVNGKPVQVACRMAGEGKTAKFITGDYDRSKLLVIDPLIAATDFYTPSTGTCAQGDSSGNLSLVTSIQTFTFPTTAGAYQSVGKGQVNVVLTKISADFGSILFGTYIGPSVADSSTSTPCGLSVDSSGDYTLSGTTNSVTFPTTKGAYQKLPRAGNTSNYVFVARLNATGTKLELGSVFGPGTTEATTSDSQGNVWLAGNPGTDYPVTDGSTGPGGFVSELSADGSSLLLSTLLNGGTTLQGQAQASPTAIAVDNHGNVYVAGIDDTGATFPTTSGAPFIAGNGFLVRLSSGAGGVLSATDLPSDVFSDPVYLLVNHSSQPVVYLTTTTTGLPTTSHAIQPTLRNPRATYLAIFSSSLSALGAATYIDGTEPIPADNQNVTTASALSVDPSDNVVVFGNTSCYTLFSTPGAFLPDSSPFGVDYGTGFIVKLNPALSSVTYGTYLWQGYLFSCAIDGQNNAYIAGDPIDGAYVTPRSYSQTYNGTTGGYMSKIALEPGPVFSVTPAVQVAGLPATGTITLAAPTATDLVVPLTFLPTEVGANLTIPSSVTIPAGKSAASFPVVSDTSSDRHTVGIWAKFPAGYQSFLFSTIPPEVSSVNAVPNPIEGGTNLHLTINLTGPAPNGYLIDMQGGQAVPNNFYYCSSNVTSLAETVPIGTVTSTVSETIYFQAQYTSIGVHLVITPTAVPIRFTPSQSTCVSGNQITGTVTLDGPINTATQTINLTSSNVNAAGVPKTETGSSGASTISAPITAYGVAQNTPVTLTGTADGYSASTAITVLPANLLSLTPTLKTVAVNAEENCEIALNGWAPAAGATVTLASSNTTIATVPASTAIHGEARYGSFVITGKTVSPIPVTITATYLGKSVTTSVTVTAAVGVKSLTFNAASVAGGSIITGTVTTPQTMNAATVILLTALNESIGNVPTSVTIPAGTNTASFNVRPNVAKTAATVTVTAKLSGASATGTFSVVPASLVSIVTASGSVTEGVVLNCSVNLNGYAPTGGAVVTLKSSNTAAPVPASITIPAGKSSATFAITAGTTKFTIPATVTATYSGVTQSVTFTVNP